jgi:hypothetical protein
MSEQAALDFVRFVWLTLATMMLASRVVFQLAGSTWMRAFLDTWQTSRTKRIWGLVSLACAAAVAGLALAEFDDPSAANLVVAAVLVLVLVVDGAVNVLPAGFETFKDRVQQRWVAQTGDGGNAGDATLFAVGNAMLAAASAGAAAAVALYRSIDIALVLGAAATGLALTVLLIAAARAEAQP